MELVIRHPIDCDAEAFWKCVFDDEYNRRLYLETLKFREYSKVSFEEKGDVILRKLKVNPPPMDLPAPVAKIAGDVSWVEDATFDKKAGKMKVKILTSSMPDKTNIFGEMWCESKGEKKIERIAKFNIEVKVFMVGGVVEKSIANDMQKNFATAAKFTNEFVKEKGW